MQADFPVVLDACVLVPPKVCDLMLRLAETPRLYLPKWSAEILEEVHRTQTTKLSPRYPEELADYWREEVTRAFPEAMIHDYDHLVESMENHAKDRHVLAAAVHEKVSTVVTFNLKDFKTEHLSPWGIEAKHPQDFLLDLYDLEPPTVTGKIALLAEDAELSVHQLLAQLGKSIPRFSEHVMGELGLEP